jgi:Transcriptional regulatory protein, C terminal
VEATSDGLRLHDAVQSAIVERLRAVDPERFRRYRAAAWHHLQSESRSVARRELARSTADLLFLIDNPVVREAMFPTGVHAYSVEPSRLDDRSELRSLWHRHDPPEAAHALDLWLERVPSTVGVIRDRSGALVGCSIVAEWCEIPPSLERDDPVTGAYARHAALHPLPNGQRTLVVRRSLAHDTGEGPSGAQAAAWLDCKRRYFRMRPQLGRTYIGIADPTPFADALAVLGFEFFAEPVSFGDGCYHLAALEFGPESVDGWLSRLAAAELGIAGRGFLDPGDRTVDLGAQRVQLSPLEFGVLATLSERPGRAVTRAELITRVWGTTYVGGSNVVDVVVRNLRRKLGPAANRVETARGVGYRLN